MKRLLKRTSAFVLVIVIITSALTVNALAVTYSKTLPIMNGFWNNGDTVCYSNAVGYSITTTSPTQIVRSVNVTGRATSSIQPCAVYVVLYWTLDGITFYEVDFAQVPTSGTFNVTFNVAQYGILARDGEWWIQMEGYRNSSSGIGAITLNSGRMLFDYS